MRSKINKSADKTEKYDYMKELEQIEHDFNFKNIRKT